MPGAGTPSPKEIKDWVNSLTINDRKKHELQEWLKQVDAWIDAQTDDGFIAKSRRAVGLLSFGGYFQEMSLN